MELYCFDFNGAYLGHLDNEGVFFTRDYRKLARVGEHGGVYDFDGRYLGRIDAQGSFFDTGGTCRAYVRNWTDRNSLAGYDLMPQPRPLVGPQIAPRTTGQSGTRARDRA